MSLNTIRMQSTDCFWSDIFTEEELDKIIEYCETIPKEDASVDYLTTDVSNIKPEIRKTTIAWIHRNFENDWFFSRIDSASNKLNAKFFGLDINPLNVIQYTIYNEEGSHYNWHWDCFIGNNFDGLFDPEQRKVSAVLQLSNPEDYEGGDLELLPCGQLMTVEKKRGMLFAFPSFVLHRVTPVNKGDRKTLVAWFTGPDWR